MPDQLRGEPPVLVMLLPPLPGLAERTNTAASKSLIPINLAILCGGMLLSIGGSTKHCRAYATVGRASARTFKAASASARHRC